MLTWLPLIPASDNTGTLVKRTHVLQPKFTTYWRQDRQVLCVRTAPLQKAGTAYQLLTWSSVKFV